MKINTREFRKRMKDVLDKAKEGENVLIIRREEIYILRRVVDEQIFHDRREEGEKSI